MNTSNKLNIKQNLLQTSIITIAMLSVPLSSSSYGFMLVRDLKENEFFAKEQGLLSRTQDWYYGGNLAAVNQPWENRFNVVNPLGIKLGEASTGGTRFVKTENKSYELQFQGKFNPYQGSGFCEDCWNGDLKTSPVGYDAKVAVPQNWQTADGYKDPDQFASFKREYMLLKEILGPGENGCPETFKGKEVTKCTVEDVWFAGELDLRGELFVSGDISSIRFGQETVTLRAKADRTTDFLINEKVINIADIEGSNLIFQLDDGQQLDEINFKFQGTKGEKKQEVTFEAGGTWKPQDESTAFTADYDTRASMIKFTSAGVQKTYIPQLRDAPDSVLGISGVDFTAALASISISALLPNEQRRIVAKIQTVPEPSTILGTLIALGFGACLSRKKLSKK
jgi:hypothetical protein